ncbi:MAG: putative cytosol aminopeptidase [Actinomycetia bacterium]|nr:putative cytosol aminopeptidase [Actinomycetes bacterium]
MAPTCSLISTPADRVRADLLAVAVFADRELGPGAEAVDDALGGGLGEFMDEADFSGKRGETLAVPTNGQLGAKAVVLVGMGKRDDLSPDAIRRAGAALARRAKNVRSVATTLLDAAPPSSDPALNAQALAEGVALGSYQFLRYKRDAKPSRLERVLVIGRNNAKVRAALDRASAIAAAVSWARDLVNEPAGAKAPADVVTAARALLRGTNIKVKVYAGEALERERFGGVVGVGQGSERAPRFLRLAYEPAGAKTTLALVGKGVVFDSGGLSLKTAGGMETMKTDMSGGAAVIAAMSVLAQLNVKTRVLGYVPLVENMPSGTAIRPGDVLTIRNGKTVEVLNTDAEGRLILADALSLAVDEKADAIVDIATLTGACMVALGDKVAGLMGSDDPWVAQVRDAADRAGEPVWPLPLPTDYRKLLDSEIADLRNISSGSYGGALTAGLFLKEFASDVAWAHLDIAGPARASSDDGYNTKGGTGFGVRTLIELATTFSKP